MRGATAARAPAARAGTARPTAPPSAGPRTLVRPRAPAPPAPCRAVLGAAATGTAPPSAAGWGRAPASAARSRSAAPAARRSGPAAGHARPTSARRSARLARPVGPTIVTISPGRCEIDIRSTVFARSATRQVLDRTSAHALALAAQSGQTPSASTTVARCRNRPRRPRPERPSTRSSAASATGRSRQIRKAGACAAARDACTGDEGVEPLDHGGTKPCVVKEIQRPVGHRRLRAQPLGAQTVEDVISAHGAVRLEQDLEHTAAHRGQLQPAGVRRRTGPRWPARRKCSGRDHGFRMPSWSSRPFGLRGGLK